MTQATKGRPPAPEILTAVELQRRLKLGKLAYRGLIQAGLPSLCVSAGHQRVHRRHDYGEVVSWLRDRSPDAAHAPQPARRGRPHADHGPRARRRRR